MSSVCITRVKVHLFLWVSSVFADSLQWLLAWKALIHLILTKHRPVSFYRSLHLDMPMELNTLFLLFSDFSVRFLHQILHFLYCGAQKPAVGHFGHLQRQVHVRLFQLYTTTTSTIYTSVATSKAIQNCFIHSQGWISRTSHVKIPELTTTWCSISRSVRTNTFAEHGGFPLRVAINWSCSTLSTPAVCYMVIWRPFTTV